MEIIKQEVSQERWIDIPEPVRDVYRLWRPTPLYRAHRLEKALGTPARIYYKWEGVSPGRAATSRTPRSPRPTTTTRKASARITTETGAGQWGSALSFACQLFGIECKVYMVRVSYDQKPYRRLMMEAWGGKVVPSPSRGDRGGAGGAGEGSAVARQPRHRDLGGGRGGGPARGHEVLARLGAEPRADAPDGDRPRGPAADGDGGRPPGHPRRLHRRRLELRRVRLPLPARTSSAGKRKDLRVIAVEPHAAPSLTKGEYVYDFGDTGQMTPLVKMYTLGHSFIPAPIHAGGLRYHGMAPLVCALYDHKVIEAVAVHQNPTFEAALTFARAEGFLPAPEAAHAIRAVIDEALRCKASGRPEGHRVQLLRPRPLRPLRLRALHDGQARGLRVSGGAGEGGAGRASQGQGVR